MSKTCAFLLISLSAAAWATDDVKIAFSLLNADGTEITFPVSRVDAAVLVFVTPECPMANRYAPVLHAVATAYAGRVAFYRVYASPDVSISDTEAHEAAYHFGFAAVLDPEQKSVTACGATCTPEVAVLDASGTLQYRGAVDDRYADLGKYRQTATREYLREALDALLGHQAVAIAQTNAIGCFIPSAEKKP